MIFDGFPIHQTDRKKSAARPDEKKKRLYTLKKPFSSLSFQM
jgi:hypothetical protein